LINLPVRSTGFSAAQILIVEDERVIARDIRACLENLGYSISAIASSAAEAIEKAAEMHPDLVLMDIRLKGEVDGIQAAQQIWNRFQIPFIYATGYSDKPTLERARATAPFGYILKPIEERELFVAIETALQRFRLEIELKQREQWLTTILRGIGDGVIVVDTQMRVKFLNVVAEVVLGCQQATVYDQPLSNIFQIIHEQTLEPIVNPAQSALEVSNIVFLSEQTALTIAAGTIPIVGSAAPLRDDQGTLTGVVLVFRDITEKRLAEEQKAALLRTQQLQEQMLELQRLNHLKDDFLNTVSHELRTPLANIKMAIRMLEITFHSQQSANSNAANPNTSLSPRDPSRYLEILRDQCDRELQLINDLLDFQRLNADAYTLDVETINLTDWITEVTDGFQGRLQHQQLQLQVNLGSDMPTLISDSISLNRVLAELLSNACKYTPPGGRITISAQTLSAEWVQLQLCNSGIEIAPDELIHIFEPFYRVPGSDRWNQGGTGLGLSLVRKLMDVLGGTIEAESRAGQTCFTLTIPVQPPLAASESDSEEP
jgi:PAS domain S-box-containing protein